MNFFKSLFNSNKPDFKVLIKNGAQIIDVRTPDEYRIDHIKGSINIPVQILQNNLSKLIKDKPIITCCASGIRSSQAKAILKSNGFENVENGGGWSNLKNKIA